MTTKCNVVPAPFSFLHNFDTFSTITVYYELSFLLVNASIKYPANSLNYINEAFKVCEKRRSKLVQDYFNKKNHKLENSVNIQNIQNKLIDNNSALLEYSIHNSFCLLWVITDNDCNVFTIDINELFNRIESLRQILRNRKAILKDYNTYIENASFLYKLLIKPAEEYIADKQNLIIIPDLYLHLVPFQLLLTEPAENHSSNKNNNRLFYRRNSFCKLPYLIKRYNISYLPSSSILLSDNSNISNNKLEEFIAFAPIKYNQIDTGLIFENLPGTKEEVIGISKLFEKDKITIKLEKEAKKEYLLNNNNYRL